MIPEEYLRKGYEMRKANRNVQYLQDQLHLRNVLASHGWYEIPEPEEGEGESIVHTNDLELAIRGYVMGDSIVFDPGEDNFHIRRSDYLSDRLFIQAVRKTFDMLVKEWYGPFEDDSSN
jgi:hypothetical protein